MENLSGRELNVAVAEEIMGLRLNEDKSLVLGLPGGIRIIPAYSSDLNLCFRALRQSGLRAIVRVAPNECEVIIYQWVNADDRDELAREFGTAGEEAQTICRALLRAAQLQRTQDTPETKGDTE